MNEEIRKIINAGVMAPSGDNCQPWKFNVADNVIELFNVLERDQSLYNFQQNASMIAFGAVLENMSIAALGLGHALQISLLPEANNTNFVARCFLAPTDEKPNNDLADFIYKRSTNRKPYKDLPLTSEQVNNILLSAEELGVGEVRVIYNPEEKKVLAKFLSRNEKIVLENQGLHSFLFNHICWSEEEEKQKKDGLYIRTLELSPPQTIGFRLFRYWPVAKVLNKLGAANIVAAENAGIYEHSAAFIAFVISNNTPRDFIAAGRLLQRTWLKVTSMNFSAQPLTGITFLHQRVLARAVDVFTDKQVELIESSYKEIERIFSIEQGMIAMILRIGDGGIPSATSSRLEPIITIIE